MSCCVSKVIRNKENQITKIVVAADRCASNTLEQGTIAHSKVFVPNDANGIIIGLCGSIRELNILEAAELVDIREESPYNRRWVIDVLVPRIINALTESGAVGVDATNRLEMLSMLLVATNKGIFTIQQDFSVIEYAQEFLAIGAGADVAKGILMSAEMLGVEEMVDTAELLTTALECVEETTVGVRAPFDVFTWEDEEEEENNGEENETKTTQDA